LYEENGRAKHRPQEMAFLCKPLLEIRYSVHRWIHLPTQLSFDTLNEARDSLQAHIADDH